MNCMYLSTYLYTHITYYIIHWICRYYQLQHCWKLEKSERPDFKQLLHTLHILSQSPWTHLLFKMSEKRKGYINETHQIFLHPLHTSGDNGRKLQSRSQATLRNVPGTTSGMVSDMSTEETEIDKSSDRNKWRIGWRSSRGSKGSTDMNSNVVENFERQLILGSEEVTRQNPLILMMNNS